MFQPKTDKIRILAEQYPNRIKELEDIFDKKTNVYIDFANVIGWQRKLKWRLDLKRLMRLFESFDTFNKMNFYNGTLEGDINSGKFMKEVASYGCNIITKPVKIMRISIDVSSIPVDSPAILKDFIRAPLLEKMSIETIKYLNSKLQEFNQQGVYYLEDKKCNFDVEIGRDMLLDYAKKEVDNFILWSGDSDFADPIRQLLKDNKKVVLFATVRRVASELNDLKKKGLYIFDIQKIRDFICWKKEMECIKSKRDSYNEPPSI